MQKVVAHAKHMHNWKKKHQEQKENSPFWNIVISFLIVTLYEAF